MKTPTEWLTHLLVNSEFDVRIALMLAADELAKRDEKLRMELIDETVRVAIEQEREAMAMLATADCCANGDRLIDCCHAECKEAKRIGRHIRARSNKEEA